MESGVVYSQEDEYHRKLKRALCNVKEELGDGFLLFQWVLEKNQDLFAPVICHLGVIQLSDSSSSPL
jgi:hypothetical protein